MAQPTGGDLYVSVPLSNISVAYMQGQEEFIADQVFPPVPVQTQAGQYWKYDRGNWFRTAAQKRAPRTESAGTGWTVTRDTFFADVNAVHVDVSDQDRANARGSTTSAFDLDSDATKFVTRDLLLRREKDWSATYFNGSAWSNTTQTGVSGSPSTNQFKQWDKTSSTPIEDIRAQATRFGEMTGYRPNKLILGWQVYDTWVNHTEFIERIKYSERGIVSKELMAALLDVGQILVSNAIENLAPENADPSNPADLDFHYMYGKDALLVYAADNPGLMQPSAGYTFEWAGYLGSPGRGTRTKKFRMEELEADRIEAESAYDFKVVSPDLGVFFQDAIS
jgi:hypothetical protein